MSNKGLLVVISGPSGVGKTTLCRQLNDEQIAFDVVTCTSRAPRQGEQEGVHYYFLDREVFEQKIKNNEFIEYATVYGEYKGILRSEIERGLASGKTLMLNIDVQGAQTIRKSFDHVLDIFIDVPDIDELKKRLQGRNEDSQQEIDSRLQAVQIERACRDEFTHVVVNDDLEKCFQKLKALIQNYRKEQHV